VTLYYSMPFQVTVLGGLTTNPAFICGFNNSAGAQSGQPTVVGARIYARLDGSGYDLGIGKNDGNTSNIIWYPNALTLNSTNFIVAAYGFSGTPAASNDTVSLWINPSLSTFGGAVAPAPDVSTSIGNNMGSTSVSDEIASFVLREDTTLEPAIMNVGAISVGTTWADVTPPTLQLVPFPIISRSLDNTKSNFILTWLSVPGHQYQVIGTTNITTPRSTWTNVGSAIIATNTNTSATNPVTPTKNFFGVIGH
jgi:hypothetical protein